MNEKIELKIMQLKNSVKKTNAIAETLKTLIPNAKIDELLRIQFVASILQNQTFGIFETLEDNAIDHAKRLYP